MRELRLFDSKSEVWKRIYKNEVIKIESLDGKRTIFDTKNVFKIVSSELQSLQLKETERKTPKTHLIVYKMIKDGRIKEVLNSYKGSFRKLCLTQDQIVEFCIQHQEYLTQNIYGNFFIIRKRWWFFWHKYFVINVWFENINMNVKIAPLKEEEMHYVICEYRLITREPKKLFN